MNVRSSSGQILVLILLVVLVGMTVALSVASRTLTSVRNQSDLSQSNRAFSVAEAGIEKALLQLKSSGDCTNNACNASTEDGILNTVTAIPVGDSQLAYGVSSLPKDEVLQLNLSGYSGSSVDLFWGQAGDKASDCSNSAAISLTLIYTRGGQYGIAKQNIDPCNTDPGNAARSATNFDGSALADPSDTLTLQGNEKKAGYGYKRTILLTGSGGLANSGDVLVGLRAKLLYVGSKPVAFRPYTGLNLPAQGQQITSTAVAGSQQRTVKVLRSNLTVPAIFDYALFNGSTATLSK